MNRKHQLAATTLATFVVAANGFSCVFAGIYGGRCLTELYGNAAEFPWSTRLALSAPVWAPIVLATAYLLYLIAAARRTGAGLAFGLLATFASGVTALVVYGMSIPFARTNFRMAPPVQTTARTTSSPATTAPSHQSITAKRSITLKCGMELDKAESLLIVSGARDFSDSIATTPASRPIITADNAYEAAESLGLPINMGRSEMAAWINSKFDPRLPLYADLKYWKFANGTDLQIYATGELRGELRVAELTLFPNGYPADKMQRDKGGTVVRQLQLMDGAPHWEQPPESSH